MRPFILDQKVRKELTALKEYAESHPVTMDDMLDTMNGARSPIGDDPYHVWVSQFGFRLVVSLEEHPEGDLYHISVSIPEVGKLPNPQAVGLMMAAMGLDADPKDWYNVRVEKIGDIEAINVWVK